MVCGARGNERMVVEAAGIQCHADYLVQEHGVTTPLSQEGVVVRGSTLHTPSSWYL